MHIKNFKAIVSMNFHDNQNKRNKKEGKLKI